MLSYCPQKCELLRKARYKKGSTFGSLAISSNETHGFASRPHGRFAIIAELRNRARAREKR